MDLDKQQGIKHVKREDLGDFGADNIAGFMNYIEQEIGDDENSILPQVMEKNAESEFLYRHSVAHREGLDTITGMPTGKITQKFEDHYTPKRENKDWVDSQQTF
tara:strand:- start:191 stop:502 length:312 start_codon:yes stop_codon:yes gene_type:complete